MIKKISTLILVMSLSLSCTKQNVSSEKQKANISFYMDPPAFDPRKTGSIVDSALSFMLFSGLNRALPNGRIAPGLAKHYEISEDQTVYTFYLRDATWTDGQPITAYDFENSWKKIIDPTFPSLTTKLFYCIKNAEQAALGKISLDEVPIRALDEKTLQVELSYPTPYFLSLTAFCAFFPAPLHIVEDEENWDINPSSSFVSSGPFKLVKWSPKKELILEKNPDYWSADEVKLDQLHIHIIENPDTALQMFEKKELDFLGSPLSPLPYHASALLSKKKGFKKTPIAGSCFLTFNTATFPFHNLSIRQAFSYALDRENMIQSVTFNNQKPAKRIIPPPFEDNEGDYLIPNNNIEKAKQCLKKGLQELNISKEELQITLQISSKPEQRKISEAIQKQLRTVLDIEIAIKELPHPIHMSSIRAHNHQIAIAQWIFQYNDVMNIFTTLREKNSPINYSQWEDARFTAFLDQAAKTKDKDQYYAILKQAETFLIEHLPTSPLYHLNYLTIEQEGFKDVVIGEVGDLHFEFANKGSL